jgi:hypothetical protein
MSEEPKEGFSGYRAIVSHRDVVQWTRLLVEHMSPVFGHAFSALEADAQIELAMRLFSGAMAELADDLARRAGFTGPVAFQVFTRIDDAPAT